MAVIVKAAGLLLLLYALVQVPDRVSDYVLYPEKSGYLLFGLVVFPLAFPLAMGALLFWFPVTAASVVGGTSSAEDPALERTLQAVIFAGIGLYTALQNALNLAYYLTVWWHVRIDYPDAPLGDPTIQAGVIVNAVGVAVGVVLLIGARGVAALVTKLRGS